MKAAILAVFPDNTAGVVSNVTMYLGGALGGNYVPIIGNSDYGVFDVGLWIQFAAYRNAAGKAEGYMDPNLLQYNRLILEWQNLTPYIPTPSFPQNHIFSASRTNGTVNWSKRWGLRNGEIQTGTLKLFVLMGDVLVVAGPYIDTE